MKFAWQAGYGIFSVSQSDVENVRRYIVGQEEHHRRKTFQEEYKDMLHQYRVQYDEGFLWG
jgi:hypothetical protein